MTVEFTITPANLEKIDAKIFILPYYASATQKTAIFNDIPQLKKYIDKNKSLEKLLQKMGSTHLITLVDQAQVTQVLLVSLGKLSNYSDCQFQTIFKTIATNLQNLLSNNIAIALDKFIPKGRNQQWGLRHASRILADGTYRFTQTKTDTQKIKPLNYHINFISDKAIKASDKVAINEGKAIAEGMHICRDLGNLAANICTPQYLADFSVQLAQEHQLECEILDEAGMEKLGMGALLSVSAGSAQSAKLIVLQYHGAKKSNKPLVLVGKGVTFDSGGISLKSRSGMDEMKYDMCGAASVLGCLKAVSLLKLPINLVCIIPTTENMIGYHATKPGDIVYSMKGLSIEILNTDAEGRLILCDALTYAERFKPECVIDIATLTGASKVALGNVCSVLLANNEQLAQDLLKSGQNSTDYAWQLPLWEQYHQSLHSNFADLPNIGDGQAGSIVAACFLSRFTENYPWAHLDIASTAWYSGAKKNATGRPIPLLLDFFLEKAKK